MNSHLKLALKATLISIVCCITLFNISSCRDQDKTPPVITLVGTSDTTIDQFTAFKEPGYSATDDRDGDLTPFISIKGQVDESVAKIYTIQYKVSDKAGNFAFKVRTVTVNEQ